MLKSIKFVIIFLLFGAASGFAQNEGHDQANHDQDSHENAVDKTEHTSDDGHHTAEYDPKDVAFHHIGNQNIYSIGSLSIPLPCILYAPEEGWSFFMSSKFEPGHHGNGHNAYEGYVLAEGSVFRITDPEFPKGKEHLDKVESVKEEVDGTERNVVYAYYHGSKYRLDARTTYDGGFLGGGVTSFFDFSMTKNVVFMILVAILLLWMFISIAKAYKKREGKSPKGMQSFFEPIIVFIRDEVAIPFIGEKHIKYLPFLLTIFFFILALNLLGQVPFFGSANVTGNLTFTAVLAIITFLVVNLSGKRDYWEHIVWMPGAPWWVKATVLTPVEVLGLFIKPFTLMLRLFANITAGHMVVLTFVGLIFIFGKSGESLGGALAGLGLALPLTLFMMALELLVAFIQAFVFTMLAASYIGAAIEEHH